MNDRVAKSTIKNELRRQLRTANGDLVQATGGAYYLAKKEP